MANYAQLKAAIQQAVDWDNHNNEISGLDMLGILNTMINSLGAGYLFAGVAKLTPTQTDPGTPDQNVFYIAAEPGSYTNFPISGGYLQVAENEVAIFKYNGQWSKETTGAATSSQVNQLGQEVGCFNDKCFTINGHYIKLTGALGNDSGSKSTDYIPVNEGEKYYYSGWMNPNIALCVAGYDSSKNFVQNLLVGGAYSDLQEITIPSGISYIRASSAFIRVGGIDWKGTLYNQFGKEHIDLIDNVADLKNDASNIITGVLDGVSDALFTINGYYINTSGSESENADCKATPFLQVKEGEKYYYSGWLSSHGAAVVGYDENKNFVSIILQYGQYATLQTVTIPSGISYIRASSVFATIGGVEWRGRLLNEIGRRLDGIEIQPLAGKKIVFFGDSLTASGGYITEFCLQSGAIGYNRGIGGTTISQISSSLAWRHSLVERVDLATDETIDGHGQNIGLPSAPDMVVMFAGVNDWGRVEKDNFVPENIEGTITPSQYITGCRFGDFSVEDKTTLCGGARYVMRRLKEKYPSIPIIVVLPLHAYSPDNYKNWCEYIYADAADESSNLEVVKMATDLKSYVDYRNALKEIAHIYGLPVIDTFEIGFNPFITSDESIYYNEGLHPNALGYRILGDFLYKKIINIPII